MIHTDKIMRFCFLVCKITCTHKDSQLSPQMVLVVFRINPLNAELNPICHLLVLLGAHHILHVSRIRVKYVFWISVLCLWTGQSEFIALFMVLNVWIDPSFIFESLTLNFSIAIFLLLPSD